MTRALAAMLTRAIDYAGMFPPAQLALASAFDNYSRYRSGPEAWIVGRFVARTTELDRLANLIASRRPPDPSPIVAVGRGGGHVDAWEADLQADADALNAFEAKVGDFAVVEAYETRLPAKGDASSWMQDLYGFSGVDVYAELPWGEGQGDVLAAAAELGFVNVKARTGGEAAAAFPSSTQLAALLQGVAQLGLQLKLTAGLHHAFPQLDDELGVRVHGFVPVFAAMACSVAHDLSVREICAILECDSPAAFAFSEEGLAVHNWNLDLDALADTRECLAAFGSCSVSEPLATLARAGLDTN
ncbi:MAG: hypothetical protein ACYC96_11455 [Fimbriimonadaceae bacterium]